MDSLILDSMNDLQKEAISADTGPILVVAGPGSGKTRVLTHRIAYLIQEMDLSPRRIMAVTFTNKAASEMRERVELLLGQASRDITLGTFHSICARILRREAEYLHPFTREFAIYDTSDQKNLMKAIIENDLGLDLKKYPPSGMLNLISSAKNELVSPEAFPVKTYKDEVVQRIYKAYSVALQKSNAMDFDDLLMHVAMLFRDNSEILERYHRYYNYILVDEFQDTNLAQYELVRLLSGPARNIFVVGDPDQSIYAFRGADYRNVALFREEFTPHEIYLKDTYRSHQHILDAAMSVIRKNPDHIKRELVSQNRTQHPLIIHEAYDNNDEGYFIVDAIRDLIRKEGYLPSDIAVMFRLNAQSRSLEEAFRRSDIPYVTVGTTRFYSRREIKDIRAYLQAIHNLNDTVNVERIINVPPRGIGNKTLDTLRESARQHPDGIGGVLYDLAEDKDAGISGRARTALKKFADLIVKLREVAAEKNPMEVLDHVLAATGYEQYLRQESGNKKQDGGDDRLANIEELRQVAFENSDLSLGEFLEKLSLVADIDVLDNGQNAVKLMTLHSAKGLEFRAVFLCGLEEEILPHWRAREDATGMAEERRLMYVGLTRAKERIYLTYAYRRIRYGEPNYPEPSRFIFDIPDDITTGLHTLSSRKKQSSSGPVLPDSLRATARQIKSAKTPRIQKRETQFQTGQRVYHVKFGEGTVLKSVNYGDMEEVHIDFDAHGDKRIDSNFLKTLDAK